MASIGGISVFSLMGGASVPGMETTLKSRPGVNGYDVQQIGVRGKSYTLTMRHDFVSGASLQAARSTLAALEGTLVTFTTDLGETFNDQLVQRVEPVEEKACFKAVGGFNSASGDDRIFATFRITLVGV